MKIIRYEDIYGQTGAAAIQSDGSARRIDGDVFGDHHATDEAVAIRRLLAPVEPVQIFGIGLNYRKHAEETNAAVPEYPVVFMKGLNAVQDPGEAIAIPSTLVSNEVDYECELAIVIGRRCRNVQRDRSLDYVLGYTCANDVSARDWQIGKGGSQWCRGKSFDTFCPLGPVLVTSDEIANPNDLQIKTTINGRTYQDSNTSDMIFDVATLIEFLSGDTTLLPGTVILTGTPQGVGMAAKPPRWLRPSDTVAVEIERIGILTNPVIAGGAS